MTDVARTITVANYEIDVYELENNSDFFKIYYHNVDNECENNTLVLDKIYYDRSDLIAIKVLHEIGIFYTTYHKPVKSK
jgi:hypothetical protein